jgi:alpha-methylacyl-CoA racemase
LQLAGLAPAPFAGLILADWGASVVRIDKVDQEVSPDLLCRGKRTIAIDIKHPNGKSILLQLIAGADVLIDPFRPGVLERLGLGPEVFHGANGMNKRLVFSRIFGYVLCILLRGSRFSMAVSFPSSSPQQDMAGELRDLHYKHQWY